LKVRVADYIADWLTKKNIEHIFTITGGGAMHLNDAFGKHPKLKCIYNHHEQASAMAAESYARIYKKIALVCVTSGPGGTNAITGVLGGWLDSIPMLVISGQVRFNTTVRSTGLKLRQLGDQEFDIIKVVAPMTKYAEMIIDPNEIFYHLEKAYYLAVNGRLGPCWLDIPLDVQGAIIDTKKLRKYDPKEDKQELAPKVSKKTVLAVLEKIQKAKRPVLYAGSAISNNGLGKKFIQLAEMLNIPVVTGFNAHDCIDSGHRLYIGRPGTIGDRPGNFAVQNSDLLLVLGCSLNIRQTGYNFATFARNAYKIRVDIDPVEFRKPTIKTDMVIHADVADFIDAMLRVCEKNISQERKKWLKWCVLRKDKYPVVLKEYWKIKNLVNPYCFMSVLSDMLTPNHTVVTANASACICAFQAIKIKSGQRLYSNSGAASMGYDLPAAIGAYYASQGREIVCLAGDGSIQMNLQELETIAYNKIPVKIFVLNNKGYHSIRQTQTNFFDKPLIGCEAGQGVDFPDMKKLAAAYSMHFIKCKRNDDLKKCVSENLKQKGPAICEVMITPEQTFAPRASSKKLQDGRMVSKPLEDMYPFLDRDEFRSNMLIPVIEENE